MTSDDTGSRPESRATGEPAVVEPMDGPERVILAQPRFLAWITSVFVLIPVLTVPAIPAAAVVAVVPLLMVVWLVRSRVVLDADGIEVRGLTGATTVPWSEVEGFSLAQRGRLRSPVLLQRSTGEPIPLPTVGRDELALLAGQAARLGASS